MFCRRSQRDGMFFFKSMFILTLFLASTQASSIRFTNTPPDNREVQPGDDVSLSWSFAYSGSVNNPSGPWNAQGVQEISFGIWKPIHGKTFFVKKIVVVDSNGVFKIRDEYSSTMHCNRSANKLTFTLKGFNVTQDQATYGINVELGLTQKSLQDTVRVYTGASYMGLGDISIRNETAYASETVELLFKRSPKDQNDEFSKYKIYKENVNVSIINLGGNVSEDGKCVTDSVLLDHCHKRFSLRYVNDTYVSFRIRNLTLEDSGLYFCQTYFGGLIDPGYAEISLSVQERPSTWTPETVTPTQAHEKTKSGHSDIQFSVALMSALMIFQALFQLF